MKPLKIEKIFNGFKILFGLRLFGFAFNFEFIFLDFSNPFIPHIWKSTLSAFLKSNQFDCWVLKLSIFFFFATDALAH